MLDSRAGGGTTTLGWMRRKGEAVVDRSRFGRGNSASVRSLALENRSLMEVVTSEVTSLKVSSVLYAVISCTGCPLLELSDDEVARLSRGSE